MYDMYIVAVLTKPRMSKNVYFLIVESGLCFCICENPGLPNQSDKEVKVIRENQLDLMCMIKHKSISE